MNGRQDRRRRLTRKQMSIPNLDLSSMDASPVRRVVRVRLPSANCIYDENERSSRVIRQEYDNVWSSAHILCVWASRKLDAI